MSIFKAATSELSESAPWRLRFPMPSQCILVDAPQDQLSSEDNVSPDMSEIFPEQSITQRTTDLQTTELAVCIFLVRIYVRPHNQAPETTQSPGDDRNSG